MDRSLPPPTQFRRLAINHRAKAILSGDPHDDPLQPTDPKPIISGPIISGTEIHARRTALGMTQGELARVLDVTQATLSRWENGASPVAHLGMLRLALDALAMRKDDRPRDEPEACPARHPPGSSSPRSRSGSCKPFITNAPPNNASEDCPLPALLRWCWHQPFNAMRSGDRLEHRHQLSQRHMILP